MPRITDYNNATALTGSELFVIDQSSVTKKATANQLKAFITYTLSAASGASLGGILSGGDISVDPSGVVTVLDNSHNHQWSNITGTPTTLAGYGITDAANAVHSHPWSSIGSKPTTLLGYGITDAAPLSHLGGPEHVDWTVDQTGIYAIHPSNYDAIVDHNNLSNIGTNSHTDIDSHIASNAIHIDWTSATADLSTSGEISADRFIPDTDIAKGVSNSIQYIGGDVSQEIGASLRLFGGSFTGRANDFDFYSDGSLVLGYDHSAGLFNFTDADISTTGFLSASNLSGTNTGDQTITLTGGVTGSGTESFAVTVVPGTIDHDALNNVSAVEHLDWTTDQSASYLINAENINTFTSLIKGLTPPSGGGTDNYLRADGTWAIPPASAVTDSFYIWQLSPDAGYTWASVGNIEATNATEIMALVSGAGISIEIDGTLNAIKINSDVSELESLVEHDNLQGVAAAQHIDWTNATDNLVTTGSIEGSNLSGTNTGDQTITLTGDVTGSGTGSFSTTIANSAVTLGKIQDVSAGTFIGRNTAGTGSLEALTAAQATSLLDLFNTSNKGIVPASDGSTTKFLRADGLWSATPLTPTSSLALFTDSLKGLVPPSGGGTANYLRADGVWAPASGGGGGSVTSVGITGTDGIEVDSGSPITGSGVITLGLNLGAIDHDGLLNYSANEHIDWTVDQGVTNIHPGNYDSSGYTHPSYSGDDITVDTGALTGATVISDIDFNVTTDTLGHVTDANASIATRTLTAGDIGAATSGHNHSGTYEPIDATILRESDVDDTPANGVTTAPVSSNWAFDHAADTNAHGGPYNNYSHPNHTGQVTSTGDGATALTSSAITAQPIIISGLLGSMELLISAPTLSRCDLDDVLTYMQSNLSFGSGTVTSVAVSGTDGIEVDSGSPITGAGTITLGLNTATLETDLNHDNLTGFVANEHIDWTSATANFLTTGTLKSGNSTIDGTLTVGDYTPDSVPVFSIITESTTDSVFIDNYVGTTDATGGVIRFRKARGTEVSPTTLLTDDIVANIKAFGHDGTNFTNLAQWRVLADYSGTHESGKHEFLTTNLISGAQDVRMNIRPDSIVEVFGTVIATADVRSTGGNFWIDRSGDATSSFLFMDADTSNQTSIIQRTGTSSRWLFGKHQNPETGSDAGSDFRFVRYNDSGTFSGTPIIIRRNTGSVELENPLFIKESASANADISGYGQVWVNSSDSKLYFTNDSGTDIDLTASGGSAYSIAKADGVIASDNFANIEGDLDWLEDFNSGSDVTIADNQNEIVINNTGYYKFTCTLTTNNNNRTELIIRSYVDGLGLGYTQVDVAHNYVSRDSDQNIGGITLTTAYVLVAGAKVRFTGEGDSDGTCTGLNNGTMLLVERVL